MGRGLKVVASVTALLLFVFAMHVNSATVAAREAPRSVEDSCDYTCLTGFVDQYLKALVAHDARQIPVTDRVKFTENTIPLRLGDALWGTISGIGTYKLYFADPVDGAAGIEASIRENGTPAILLLRLKVANRKISEIEMLVHRNADDAAALERFGQANQVWTQSLETAQRVPRQEMIRIANSYFDGILHSSGDSVPFDPQCNRILDGY